MSKRTGTVRLRQVAGESVSQAFRVGMLMLVALGVMSLTWMSVIAVLVLAQKLLPPNPAIDVPVALAIVGLGILIVLAPSSVPGLTPPM